MESNKEKAFLILNTLAANQYMPLVSEVKLEAALSGFMGGRTSQQVIIKLARFNAVLEYILGERLNVPVTLVGASGARKKVLGKAFVKGMNAKEWVKQELPKHVPNLEKYIKLNKRGNYDKRNEDTLDAIVISRS
jgi:membrane associated rhomboid family serine protease